MKLHKNGEKSRAICPFCQQLRSTTFAERDVPLSSGKGLVRDVLVAVCDTCDHVVAIPHQSVPRIKETVRYSRHSLETRLPRHLLDAVGLACHELGFDPDYSPVLFRFYLRRFFVTASLRKKLPALSSSEEARGQAKARFSAKLNDQLYSYLQDLETESKLNKANVVRGIIVQIKQDILDHRRDELRKKLKEILPLAG
jgi:hypothetical protein